MDAMLLEPVDEALGAGGFWRVAPGLLIEIGDQTVDARGALRALPLEQVGRAVAPGAVVLRMERRRGPREGPA